MKIGCIFYLFIFIYFCRSCIFLGKVVCNYNYMGKIEIKIETLLTTYVLSISSLYAESTVSSFRFLPDFFLKISDETSFRLRQDVVEVGLSEGKCGH